uniref:di-N-acetylchitobiase-like isoform X3 n=1 Tax=Pristiophorus japonicus TaxID=55135 RepID=UPI00398ED421
MEPAVCGWKSHLASVVVVFDIGGKDWKHYDWSKVTTVIAVRAYDPELLCHAHANDVRVLLTGRLTRELFTSSAMRTDWINSKIQLAKKQFMDGLLVNYQQFLENDELYLFGMIELIHETTQTFHREIPGSQVCPLISIWVLNPESSCWDLHCLVMTILASTFLSLVHWKKTEGRKGTEYTVGGRLQCPSQRVPR